MKALTAVFTLLVALFSSGAFADWEQVPGEAIAIAVGANGEVWAIGGARESGGFGVYHWNGVEFEKAAGIAGMRIAVDPRGFPWVVDSFNNVRRWTGRYWENLPGWSKDVGIGANGSIWSVGLEGGLYEFRRGRFEKRFPGRFERIAVAPDGEPWSIDEKQDLARKGTTGWESFRSGTASVSIGANGAVWVLDATGLVFRLGDASGLWLRRVGRFREICVGPDGAPWAVTADRRIFRWLPED